MAWWERLIVLYTGFQLGVCGGLIVIPRVRTRRTLKDLLAVQGALYNAVKLDLEANHALCAGVAGELRAVADEMEKPGGWTLDGWLPKMAPRLRKMASRLDVAGGSGA